RRAAPCCVPAAVEDSVPRGAVPVRAPRPGGRLRPRRRRAARGAGAGGAPRAGPRVGPVPLRGACVPLRSIRYAVGVLRRAFVAQVVGSARGGRGGAGRDRGGRPRECGAGDRFVAWCMRAVVVTFVRRGCLSWCIRGPGGHVCTGSRERTGR